MILNIPVTVRYSVNTLELCIMYKHVFYDILNFKKTIIKFQNNVKCSFWICTMFPVVLYNGGSTVSLSGIFLSAYLSIYISIYVCLSVCLSIYPSGMYLSILWSCIIGAVQSAFQVSVYLYIYLYVCLS